VLVPIFSATLPLRQVGGLLTVSGFRLKSLPVAIFIIYHGNDATRAGVNYDRMLPIVAGLLSVISGIDCFSVKVVSKASLRTTLYDVAPHM
jgi:hypothetical protein